MNLTGKLVLSFIGGAILGGGLGYLITKKTLESKFEKIAEEEIRSVKNHYRVINKEDYPFPTDFPIEKAEEDRALAAEKVAELGYASDDGDDQSEESRLASRSSILKSKNEPLETRTQNIWDQEKIPAGELIAGLRVEDLEEGSDRGLSYSDYKTLKMQEFMDQRRNGSDEAYVITAEEFDEETPEYDRVTLTYYAGDDVLCDSKEPIPAGEVERLVGPDALTSFGVGSNNESIVYIRNDRDGVETCFEIIQDEAEYTETILGYRQPKDNHRFREDD